MCDVGINENLTFVCVSQIQVACESAQSWGVKQGTDSGSAGHDWCRGGPVPAGTYQGALLVIYVIEENAVLCTSAYTMRQKVFIEPLIVQVLPLKMITEVFNFHHRHTSNVSNGMWKKNPQNHIVGFFKNIFINSCVK